MAYTRQQSACINWPVGMSIPARVGETCGQLEERVSPELSNRSLYGAERAASLSAQPVVTGVPLIFRRAKKQRPGLSVTRGRGRCAGVSMIVATRPRGSKIVRVRPAATGQPHEAEWAAEGCGGAGTAAVGCA